MGMKEGAYKGNTSMSPLSVSIKRNGSYEIRNIGGGIHAMKKIIMYYTGDMNMMLLHMLPTMTCNLILFLYFKVPPLYLSHISCKGKGPNEGLVLHQYLIEKERGLHCICHQI